VSLTGYPSPSEALLPTLEERVTRLEADMEEQKRLRASQDSDLSDLGEKLRVQTSLIQAIAKTQSEHTATLASHTAILTDHTQRLGRLEGSVDYLKDGVERILGMLDTLIDRERDGER
jgi:septal ring factor EnvC (AmiA/AmiB activator)